MMNQNEYEIKLLQEKIAGQRRILQIEMRQLREKLQPQQLVRRAGVALAPQILALPAMKMLRKNSGKIKLIAAALLAAALPFLLKSGQSTDSENEQ